VQPSECSINRLKIRKPPSCERGTLSEESISEVLFNLASSDRLALLHAINKQKQRLTELSKVINASAQECSRHLSRLVDVSFIVKDSDGLYETTPVGKGVLALLPGIEFLLSNKNYFLSHDLSFLPKSFLNRIGELQKGKYVEHFSQVLDAIKMTISEGREYIWLISDKPIVVGTKAGVSFSRKEIPVRLLFEPNVDRKLVDEIKSALPNSEIRALEEVKIAMGINEKWSGVIFPNLSGEIDFGAGFTDDGPEFRAWSRELFQYYWAQSRMI
jgi:predicted transcriptional regulator